MAHPAISKDRVVELWEAGKTEEEIIALTGFPRVYVEGMYFDLEAKGDRPAKRVKPPMTPLRVCFDIQLKRWCAAHPGEAKPLRDQLLLWGHAQEEFPGTLWEKIRKRIAQIAKRKSHDAAERPQRLLTKEMDGRRRRIRETPEVFSEEDCVRWLFRADTAHDWMDRFRVSFAESRARHRTIAF